MENIMARTITVTGKGRLSVHPDTIRLSLTLEGGHYKEYADAVSGAAEKHALLKKAVESAGIDGKALKTTYYNISRQTESYHDKNGNWKSRFTGYRFDERLKLDFPEDNKVLGRVLHALAHSDTDPGVSIGHTVSDPESVKNELLEKAVADSAAKARVLAGALGLAPGRVMSIDYSLARIDLEIMTTESMCMKREMDSTENLAPDLEPDDISVEDTVTVIWEIA